MSQKLITFSDLSAKEVPEGKEAQVYIVPSDKRRGIYKLDASDDEVAELIEKGKRTNGVKIDDAAAA